MCPLLPPLWSRLRPWPLQPSEPSEPWMCPLLPPLWSRLQLQPRPHCPRTPLHLHAACLRQLPPQAPRPPWVPMAIFRRMDRVWLAQKHFCLLQQLRLLHSVQQLPVPALPLPRTMSLLLLLLTPPLPSSPQPPACAVLPRATRLS